MSQPDIILACVLISIYVVIEILVLLKYKRGVAWDFVGALLRATIAGTVFVIGHFVIKYW